MFHTIFFEDMEIKNYLKFKTILTDKDVETLSLILNKIKTSSITPDRTIGYIVPLLDLIHRGLAIDKVKFLDKIFFDFYVIRTSTEPHLKRIYQQLTAIGDFK